MGMAYPRDIVGRCAAFHGYRGFGDHVCGTGPDHVYTQYLIGIGISQHLYETIRIAAGLGASAGFERERTRSEEHTSELQSLMRISYAVFCLKKKNIITSEYTINHLTEQNNHKIRIYT